MALKAEPARPRWTKDDSTELRRLGKRIREKVAALGPEHLFDQALQAQRARYMRLANKMVAAMGGKVLTADERAAQLAQPVWPGAPITMRELMGPPSCA